GKAVQLSLRAFYRLQEEFQNNRAGRYVRRLVALSSEMDKMLQVSNSASSSEPLTMYNAGKIAALGLRTDSTWQRPVEDPFFVSAGSMVLPFLAPVYNPKDGGVAGTVFLAATPALITDKLQRYGLPEDSRLFLSIGEQFYGIERDMFLPVDLPEVSRGGGAFRPEQGAELLSVKDGGGKRHTMVAYPVNGEISIIQLLANDHFLPFRREWVLLLAGLIFMIFFLALFITLNLDRKISRPAALLRKKIDAVGQGDFSPDPGLEWDDELGTIGRGINRLSRDILLLMDRRMADEKNKRDLEYRMLQSQINPHFLYNTLNSIKWMASLQKAPGIAEMTTSLSRLLRTASKDLRKVVPLRDELSLLDEYLVIQKYRYGNSVRLVKDVEDESLLDAPLPRFSLQPLAENAIFHGLEPKGGGTITVRVRKEGKDALISIIDDGIGMDAETLERAFSGEDAGSGMFAELGLRNVDERIRYAFGPEYGISAESRVGEYTSMTIRVPSQGGNGD
ncbi:sensor histidine kinase, partial [Treponema sp. OttesenSCG-928-L16]|nr:sensor histidine kinase [Treponema sp. OttesenSCG-928-L16]